MFIISLKRPGWQTPHQDYMRIVYEGRAEKQVNLHPDRPRPIIVAL